jgi:hypothetical protein
MISKIPLLFSFHFRALSQLGFCHNTYEILPPVLFLRPLWRETGRNQDFSGSGFDWRADRGYSWRSGEYVLQMGPENGFCAGGEQGRMGRICVEQTVILSIEVMKHIIKYLSSFTQLMLKLISNVHVGFGLFVSYNIPVLPLRPKSKQHSVYSSLTSEMIY